MVATVVAVGAAVVVIVDMDIGAAEAKAVAKGTLRSFIWLCALTRCPLDCFHLRYQGQIQLTEAVGLGTTEERFYGQVAHGQGWHGTKCHTY